MPSWVSLFIGIYACDARPRPPDSRSRNKTKALEHAERPLLYNQRRFLTLVDPPRYRISSLAAAPKPPLRNAEKTQDEMKTLSILISALLFLMPSLAAEGPIKLLGKGEMPFGPFPNHCFTYKLSKSYNMHGKNYWLLIAECEVAGETSHLSINLNDCIANLSGEMHWQWL